MAVMTVVVTPPVPPSQSVVLVHAPALLDSLGLNAAVAVTPVTGGWQFGNVTFRSGQQLTIRGLEIETTNQTGAFIEYFATIIIQPATAITVDSPTVPILNVE